MVTGDNWTTARAIAAKLGITDVSAEASHLLPIVLLSVAALYANAACPFSSIQGQASMYCTEHHPISTSRPTIRCCPRARPTM